MAVSGERQDMSAEQILDRFADHLKCTHQHPRRRVVFLETLHHEEKQIAAPWL